MVNIESVNDYEFFLPCDNCGSNSFNGWVRYTKQNNLLQYLLFCSNDCGRIMSDCELFEGGITLNEGDLLAKS